jgi:type I restriction enzyme S subunit
MGEIAPLVRRPIIVDPNAKYREIGIRSHGKGVFHKAPIAGVDLGEKRVFNITPGDLLFNIVFAWEGAVAVAGPSEGGMIGSHRFLTCVANPMLADAQFLRHFFMTPVGLAQLLMASPGGAGRNRTLGLASLNQIQVPLPPIKEQLHIVERLDAVSTRLKERAEIALQQKADLTAILRALIKIDAIPVRLGKLLNQRPVDVSVEKTSHYQFAGVYSFGRGVFLGQRKAGSDFAYPRLTTLHSDDFTYPKLMAWEGAFGIVPPECDGCVVSPEFPVFAVDQEQISSDVLAIHFSDPQTWRALSGGSTGTNARRRRLHPDNLLAYEMPVPSPQVQKLVALLMPKVRALRTHQTAIATDADALLPSMLNQIFG